MNGPSQFQSGLSVVLDGFRIMLGALSIRDFMHFRKEATEREGATSVVLHDLNKRVFLLERNASAPEGFEHPAPNTRPDMVIGDPDIDDAYRAMQIQANKGDK